MQAQLDGIHGELKTVRQKLDDHDRRFDTIDRNFEMLGQRQELFEGELRKVNRRLERSRSSDSNNDGVACESISNPGGYIPNVQPVEPEGCRD